MSEICSVLSTQIKILNQTEPERPLRARLRSCLQGTYRKVRGENYGMERTAEGTKIAAPKAVSGVVKEIRLLAGPEGTATVPPAAG